MLQLVFILLFTCARVAPWFIAVMRHKQRHISGLRLYEGWPPTCRPNFPLFRHSAKFSHLRSRVAKNYVAELHHFQRPKPCYDDHRTARIPEFSFSYVNRIIPCVIPSIPLFGDRVFIKFGSRYL